MDSLLSKVFDAMRNDDAQSLSAQECRTFKSIIAQQLQAQIGLSHEFKLAFLSHEHNLMEQLLIEPYDESISSYVVNLYENNTISIFEHAPPLEHCVVIKDNY